MKFILNNLGALESATLELGDLTIVCGRNNSGKTYATYSIFGLLNHMKSSFADSYVTARDLEVLAANGQVVIKIDRLIKGLPGVLDSQSKEYSKRLTEVFAGEKAHFELANVEITDVSDLAKKIKSGKSTIEINNSARYLLQFNVDEERNNSTVTIKWLEGKFPGNLSSSFILCQSLSNAIKEYVFNFVVPPVYISSAERTGAAIFQRELDFTRNRLLELLGDKASRITPTVLFNSFHGEYPVAVRSNVDFIRNIPSFSNKESIIARDNPDLIASLDDFMEGSYSATKDGQIKYMPHGGRKCKLQLGECSSSVRALLDMDFYLRHLAAPGDLYMIDEPEMNLHPARQRKLARFLARLVNCGMRIFITTHSDYIIREFSTLLMLNQSIDKCAQIAKEEGYCKQELLEVKRLRVYIAEKGSVKRPGHTRRSLCNTLVGAPCTQSRGIEVASFDDTIDQMNAIQDRILWE